MVQARQLGDELYVGVHSDEDILANKGPTVMNLDERFVFPTTTTTHTHTHTHTNTHPFSLSRLKGCSLR